MKFSIIEGVFRREVFRNGYVLGRIHGGVAGRRCAGIVWRCQGEIEKERRLVVLDASPVEEVDRRHAQGASLSESHQLVYLAALDIEPWPGYSRPTNTTDASHGRLYKQ